MRFLILMRAAVASTALALVLAPTAVGASPTAQKPLGNSADGTASIAPDRPIPPPAGPDGRVSAQAEQGDTPGTAIGLPLNISWHYHDNSVLTATGEPFGPQDSVGCAENGGAGIGVDHTVWYRITGNGARILLEARTREAATAFDHVLAVYPAAAPVRSSLISCDVGRPVGDGTFAEIEFQSQLGADYLVQFGGAEDVPFNNTGTLSLTVTGSDLRTFAGPAVIGTATTVSTFGAYQQEIGEPSLCGSTNYGSTIWLKFDVPAHSRLTFSVSAGLFQAAVALFRAAELAPIGCATGNASTLGAQLTAAVAPGSYLLQLGGVDGDSGAMTYTLNLAENLDVDGDGVQRRTVGNDCDDNNGAIRPGVKDINNGIDDDCDGIADPDRDGDGVPRRPLGNDCNDDNAKVKPGNRERRGNRVDENCDGARAPFRSLPTTSRYSFASPTTSTLLTRLELVNVPARTRVRISCKGAGCPGNFSRRYRKARKRLDLSNRVDSRMSDGTKLQIQVTKPRRRGKRFVWTMRSFEAPRYRITSVGTGYRGGG